MLRSLVGSEMCIRDRYSGPQINLYMFVLECLFVPIRCASICLLYTSDAADDLLCVDLGGRRIIKKSIHTSRHMYVLTKQRYTYISLNTIESIYKDLHDKQMTQGVYMYILRFGKIDIYMK